MNPCVVCKTSFTPSQFHPKSMTCSRRCSKRLEYRKHRDAYLSRAGRIAKENRERVNENWRNYRKRNLEKCAARAAVGRAVKSGILVRPSKCSQCGKICATQAHHYRGYEHQLDVIWLCSVCHGLTEGGLQAVWAELLPVDASQST